MFILTKQQRVVPYDSEISMSSKSKLPNANRAIQSASVRLIGQGKEQLGVVTLDKALSIAAQYKLDLVEVSPNTNPPVCKLMDFGRYKYDLKKKHQAAKKKQKRVEIKEIKIRPNIGQSDLEVKLKKIKQFLAEGNKVKVSVWFRGRELAHKDLGKILLGKVQETCIEIAKIDQEPKMEGNYMLLILSPSKK